MIYWVSWVCTEDDYRPVSCPPNENVLGWWCTGQDSNDNAILCAMVFSETYDSGVIDSIQKDWPEFAGDFRLFEVHKTLKLSDRFVVSEWMEPRLHGHGVEHEKGM